MSTNFLFDDCTTNLPIDFIGNGIGYSDGGAFISAHPKFQPKKEERINGYTYGYMAYRGEMRSPQALFSRDRMYEIGNNWVCLAVASYQKTYNSTEINPSFSRTPSERDIINFVEDAHRRGVKVCLKPMVNTEDGVWRAYISFPDLHIGDVNYYWNKWFESYREFILNYAELAQELGCEMLCIGCEMIGTENRQAEWLDLIEKVRNIYSGKLVYNANHHREDAEQWFDVLDYIGTSAYYPVGEDGLDKDKMIAKWNEIRWRLDAIAAQRNKKYLFMEIGCRSAKNCATEPWDFNTHMEVSMEEQKLFYETCLEVFTKSPYFGGVFWWDWPTTLYPIDTALQDTSYCIYGKPAEEVLKKYYK